MPEEEIPKILKAWFDAKFEGGRHADRVEKIKQIERSSHQQQAGAGKSSN